MISTTSMTGYDEEKWHGTTTSSECPNRESSRSRGINHQQDIGASEDTVNDGVKTSQTETRQRDEDKQSKFAYI